ncbi:MAG: DNRLRE domain-containing protein [Alteromonadaceae bacterium]|nr:DNRLRE domain-containing protein [Alteromonadaceae bacterium]
MIKTRVFSTKLLALALVMVSYTVSADIDYHRLVWDADPAHQAVIGFTQTNSNETATVKYGYSTDENNWSVQSVSNSQGFDSNRFTSSFVRLTGLTENSAVYYRVCEGNTCGERLWFKTAATDNSPFVMLSGGDTRTGWSTRILGNELLAKIRPLFIMHGGDFTSSNNASQMESFFDHWQLTFSNDIIDGIAYKRIYPLVPTFGNHEAGDYSTLCKVFGVDYNDDEECTDYDTYGAFDISPLLRIYTLNSEYKNSGWSTQAAAQANWLASDLAANSGNVSWRFAQYHKPLFPHSTSKSENPTLFNWWADEFYNNAMNLVFESDTHLSKVTSPVEPVGNTFQVTTTGGTVYAGEGSWGAPARSANKNYPWTLENESIQQFKILTISSDKVEIRTAQFDSGASTDVSTISAQERADNTTVLPTGVDWWSTNGIGNVITLTRSNNELSILGHSDDTSGPGPDPEPNDDMILSVVADTFISEKLLNQNFNAVNDQLLADGNDGTYGSMKMLLAWDVSAIESCSVVTAASIEMQIFNASSGTYEVYSSVNPWLENEVTWSSLSGTENQGTLVASFMPDTTGSHTVLLSADGISMVQNWITDSNNNNGIVITSEGTGDGIDVEDREQGTAIKLELTLDHSGCDSTVPSIISPANGSTGVGIDSDLIWTVGSSATSYEVLFGSDPDNLVSTSQSGTSFDPGTLAKNTTYFWQINVIDITGTTTGTLWSFTTVEPLPGSASIISPADASIDVSVDTVLSWAAGSGASSHQVLFGTDPGNLASTTQSGTSFDPGNLAYSTTYYWQINEINTGGTSSGTLWSFTTVEPPIEITNLVLPGNGGSLESFTGEYSSQWGAAKLTNGVTFEDGWASKVNPGNQEFIYSFANGESVNLSDAVIHSGTGEGLYWAKNVEVWTSTDGSNYTLAASGTLANSSGSSITLGLSGIVAKRVKLVVTSGYRSDYWEIGEFELNGW